VNERAVRGAGDIPKLSSQVGRVTRARVPKQSIQFLTCQRTRFESQTGARVDGYEKADAPHPDFRSHLCGGGQVREASRGLVGLDTSAHVLRLIDLGHKSRVWREIQRPSRCMSTRGFDERDSAESSLDVNIEAKPRFVGPERAEWSGCR